MKSQSLDPLHCRITIKIEIMLKLLQGPGAIKQLKSALGQASASGSKSSVLKMILFELKVTEPENGNSTRARNQSEQCQRIRVKEFILF